MAHMDAGVDKPRPEDLPGYTTAVTPSRSGRTALLNSDCDPEFPWWFRLLVEHSAGWTAPLPPELRLAGHLVWAEDGSVLSVGAFRGIRCGTVVLEPDSGRWWWATPDDQASYVDVVPAPGGRYVDAVRVGLDGVRNQVRVDREGGVLRQLESSDGERPCEARVSCRLVRWEVPAGILEGVLMTPTRGSGRTWPLVVDLHGGPIGAFQAGDVGNLAGWCARGFAAFRPEFRSSGILGPDAMWQAFRGVGLPRCDPEVDEVIAGVRAVADTGLVDADRTFAIGHSYGAYLLNRIVTTDHPFRAAVCWEGIADLRLLDAASLRTQSRWRGGTPTDRPDVWAAASPVERAAQISVPMLLIYGEHGLAVPHGENWLAVLRRHGVRSEYVVYANEGHLLTDPRNEADLLDRVQAWFLSAP